MRSRMRSRSASANAAAIVRNSLLIPLPAMSPPRSRRCSLTPLPFSSCFQHRLRYLLYKQRNAISTLDNVAFDSDRQWFIARDAVDHGAPLERGLAIRGTRALVG